MTAIKFHYGLTIKRAEMRANTIYLDGVVQGPVVDNKSRSYSFDHHGECERFATRSTAAQVWAALRLGFDPVGLEVIVNDVDADSVTSAWLLSRAEEIMKRPGLHGLIDGFVGLVDAVDCHGPQAYAWRSPCDDFVAGSRTEGFAALYKSLMPPRGVEQTSEVLSEKMERLDEAFLWDAPVLPGEEGGWSPTPSPAIALTRDGRVEMVDDVAGFSDLYGRGYVAGVLCAPAAEGTVGYTVAKLSDFVQFDVTRFLDSMNRKEPGWGGGSTIGGAPRGENGRRSELSVEFVRAVFENIAPGERLRSAVPKVKVQEMRSEYVTQGEPMAEASETYFAERNKDGTFDLIHHLVTGVPDEQEYFFILAESVTKEELAQARRNRDWAQGQAIDNESMGGTLFAEDLQAILTRNEVSPAVARFAWAENPVTSYSGWEYPNPWS